MANFFSTTFVVIGVAFFFHPETWSAMDKLGPDTKSIVTVMASLQPLTSVCFLFIAVAIQLSRKIL